MAYIPQHYIKVIQRPRQGGGYVGQYPIHQYRHRLVAMGGYDVASGALNVRPSEAEWIYANLIGCVVQVYADNPFEPIYEGFIERITYRAGGLTFTKSLANMANKVNVTYYNADSPAAQKTENIEKALGTVIQNTESQAIFGLKEMNLDAGVHFDNANKSHKNLLRQTILAVRSWPQISVANGGENNGALIELEFNSLRVMAWDWQNYVHQRGIPAGLDGAIVAYAAFAFPLIDPAYAGGAFLPANATSIYRTGSTLIDAYRYIVLNSTFQMSTISESGQTYLQYAQSIVEAGDGSAQYVYGITQRYSALGLRFVYYRPASTEVRYHINALRDTGRVRDIYGRIVPGWEVVPDCVFETMDIRLGLDSVGNDPRSGYVSAVEYDAESGVASIQSGDNITLEGVLQQDRYFKAHGRKAFSAPVRQVF